MGDCAEYEKALDSVCVQEEKFIKEISKYPRAYELFCNFRQSVDNLHLQILYLYFKKGFKDGFALCEELKND